jgi:hypothetical protein
MMRSAKGHQEEEEDEYEEFGSKRDAQTSNTNRDGKNNDKASTTRSKHSVTEQRRRSKINERFQILRDLIPNSDQKRDTASFLLEVIEYVQYLQEKVQKHEGSYQGWSSEPTKLMPWRNSHWRVQSFVGHPQAIKTDSGTIPNFPQRFDENNVMGPTMHTSLQDHVESDPTRDASCKLMDQRQSDPTNKPPSIPMNLPTNTGVPIQPDGALSNALQRSFSDAQQSADCRINNNQHEDLTVEGGTISISSAYSQGLLNTLTDALKHAGVDLSHATISVQVDLGKRANQELVGNTSTSKDNEIPDSSNHDHIGHYKDENNGVDSEQAHKRMKM